MKRSSEILPHGYAEWLSTLKRHIAGVRQQAALAVNSAQIRLYHHIGQEILSRQRSKGWGSKVVERLALDLNAAFPGMKGFSSSNLKYMRYFAQECPEMRIGQQSADQLPWFHIITILTKIPSPALREWYAAEASRQAWSRETLEEQLRGGLHLRRGAAVSNFSEKLPPVQAGLAASVLKDPYHFDFLGLGSEAPEREIERGLLEHITRFLLELGEGFAFVARQFRLEVDGDEFFPDLLFYHIRLKCYVVVEIKAADFRPEHTGQLNFYLSAVDARLRGADDKPTIGLLLCRNKKRLVAEYALSGMEKPIGIAQYRLVRNLPKPLSDCMPTISELESELARKIAASGDAGPGSDTK